MKGMNDREPTKIEAEEEYFYSMSTKEKEKITVCIGFTVFAGPAGSGLPACQM